MHNFEVAGNRLARLLTVSQASSDLRLGTARSATKVVLGQTNLLCCLGSSWANNLAQLVKAREHTGQQTVRNKSVPTKHHGPNTDLVAHKPDWLAKAVPVLPQGFLVTWALYERGTLRLTPHVMRFNTNLFFALSTLSMLLMSKFKILTSPEENLAIQWEHKSLAKIAIQSSSKISHQPNSKSDAPAYVGI